MNKYFKFVIILCTFSLIFTLFTGCGTTAKDSTADTKGSAPVAAVENTAQAPVANTTEAPKEDVTLRFSWWGGDTRHQATLAVIDGYMKKNPNIKIEAEYQGFDGYRDKVAVQMASGSAPDIMQLDNPWLPEFTRGNFLVDLNTYKNNNVLDTKGFDEKFVNDYCVFSNKLVALPLGINALALFINKDVLVNAGIEPNQEWTWDKILSEGKKLHEKDQKYYLLNVEESMLADLIFKPYLVQKTGKQVVNDDYTLGCDKAAVAEVLGMIKKMFDDGVAEPAGQSFTFKGKSDQNPKWVNKELGGTINWVASLGQFKKPVGESLDLYVYPLLKDALDTGVQVRPATVISISAVSEHPDEAAKFINYFFNDNEAALALGTERAIPPTAAARKVVNEANKADPVAVKAVDEAMKKSGLALNSNSNNEQIKNLIIDVIDKVAFNKSTPEAAADEFIVKAQQKASEIKSAAK